eukprot:5731026-Prymnesium_polylepis.1
MRSRPGEIGARSWGVKHHCNAFPPRWASLHIHVAPDVRVKLEQRSRVRPVPWCYWGLYFGGSSLGVRQEAALQRRLR